MRRCCKLFLARASCGDSEREFQHALPVFAGSVVCAAGPRAVNLANGLLASRAKPRARRRPARGRAQACWTPLRSSCMPALVPPRHRRGIARTVNLCSVADFEQRRGRFPACAARARVPALRRVAARRVAARRGTREWERELMRRAPGGAGAFARRVRAGAAQDAAEGGAARTRDLGGRATPRR